MKSVILTMMMMVAALVVVPSASANHDTIDPLLDRGLRKPDIDIGANPPSPTLTYCNYFFEADGFFDIYLCTFYKGCVVYMGHVGTSRLLCS